MCEVCRGGTHENVNEPEMIEFSFSSVSIVWQFIIQQTNHSRAVQYSPILGIDHIFIRIHDRSLGFRVFIRIHDRSLGFRV